MPNCTKVSGNSIDVRDEQLIKACLHIDVNVLGKTIEDKFEQAANAAAPIDVIDPLIVTDVIPEHPLNANSDKLVSPESTNYPAVEPAPWK